MARNFGTGLDRPGKIVQHGQWGITEFRPKPDGDWVNRIIVYGDVRLRDRILALLQKHGME